MATIFKNATGSDLTSTASWADPGTPVPYWTDINHGGGEVKTVLRHPTTGGYFVGGTFGIRYIAPDGTITNGPAFSGGTATVHDIIWAQALPGVTSPGIIVGGTFTSVTINGVTSTRHQIAVLTPDMTTLYGAQQSFWTNGAVYTLCTTQYTTAAVANLMLVGGDFTYVPPCFFCSATRTEENFSHWKFAANLSSMTYVVAGTPQGVYNSSSTLAFTGTALEGLTRVLKIIRSGSNFYVFGDFSTMAYRRDSSAGGFTSYTRIGAACLTLGTYSPYIMWTPQTWAPSFTSGVPYTAAIAPEGVYVGGSFQTPAANLALVSPTVSSTTFLSCATTNGPVHDIRYYDGPSGDGAVIAGNFTSPRKYVAMVNGADVMGWFEERVTPRTSPVKALAVTSGFVFAGGSATDQSSEQTNISNFTVSSVAPTIADDAIWKSWSLGGAYTGNISANSFTFDGAHGNITHPVGSTTTIGSGGWTFSPNNASSWGELGTISVGSVNQTWALSHAARGSTIQLYGNLTGSATINVTNNSGINDFGYAYIISNAANAGFNGTLALQNYTGIAPIAAGTLTQAKIQVDGEGCLIWPGNASGDTIGSSAGSLTVNNNLTLGYAGRSFTIASPVQMGSSKRTLSIAGGTTLSSHMSGTAGLAVQTTGSITLGITGPQSSISGPLDLESNTGGYGMLIGNPTGTPNQLSNITELNLNGAIYYDGNASYTEDAILNATGPNAALISRGVLALSDSSQSAFGGELWCQSNVGAYTTAQMTLNHPPEDATRFRAQVQGVTSQTGYNTRFIFNNPTGSIIPGDISLSLTTAATQAAGAVSILEDNSSGNEFTGFVSGSQVSAAFHNLGLQGSSTGSILSGNIVTGATTMGITKAGSGTWTIRGNNNHTGTNSISSGTLSLQSATALGSTAAGVVTQVGGTIEVTGGTALNKGTLGWTLASVSGASALKSTSGTNSIACGPITMSHTLPIDVAAGASLEIKNSSAMSGGGMGITKIGGGELILSSSANTYTGAVTVSEGTLSTLKIANAGSSSSLGTGAGDPNIMISGTLKNIGAGGSTSRLIVFNGSSPSLDSSGIGAVTFTNTRVASSISNAMISLKGNNSGDNTVSVPTIFSLSESTIGSGTTATTATASASNPIDGYYKSFRYQVVYTADELIASGMTPNSSISALGFSIAGDYGGGNLLGYQIKLGHTTATNSATHDSSSTTTVKNSFSYNPTVTAVGAFDMIGFDSQFIWDGTSNILVDICSSGLNSFVSPYGSVRTIAASTPHGARHIRSDLGSMCGNATLYLNSTKPQIRFYFTKHASFGFIKSDTGKWILSGLSTLHTEVTTVTEGTLDLGSTARSLTGGISITGGTLQNGSATLTSDVTASGGSILCALAGSGKTLDVVGGEVYLYPPSDNSYTGGTTVDSSAVLTVKVDSNPSTAGTGKALGGGSVLVDGELRTAAGGDQKGKLRYGGSLSFGAGAKLHIGSAA